MAATLGARRTLAVAQLILVAIFIGGAVVYAMHPDARDADVRRIGFIMLASAAALFMGRLAVGEVMANFKAAQ